jgi:hypothetical protein
MKFFGRWAGAAGLVLAATAANAQVLGDSGPRPRYRAVSDLDGPYAPPPAVPAPGYGYGYGYEPVPGPALLAAQEIYAVLRENGFSPLGAPHLRGYFYTISAIDPNGDDGRLVIDARNGRILRFMPAYGIGPWPEEGALGSFGSQGVLPEPTLVRGVPRPPAPVPHVASRTVPVPKPSPLPARAAPQPAQQAAAAQPKPAEPQQAAAATTAPTVGQASLPPPASAILPTQEMPKVQDLE